MLISILLNVIICLPLSGSSWVKIFEDQFQNLNEWVSETISGAQTGNNEWQFYTNRERNVFLRGNSLVLHAEAESYEGFNYTSGKVHSRQSFGPYGFFNIFARVPKGKALWPSIFLLPLNSPYGTWAACGEIDIMQTVCDNSDGFGTLHFGQPWPNSAQFPEFPANRYPDLVDWRTPHWFGVDWQPDFITFYLDAKIIDGILVGGAVLNKISSDHWFSADNTGKHFPQGAPFDTQFNIVLNLAVGGNFPCSFSGCCSQASVPAELEIFNVQVWEKSRIGTTEYELII